MFRQSPRKLVLKDALLPVVVRPYNRRLLLIITLGYMNLDLSSCLSDLSADRSLLSLLLPLQSLTFFL
jgi:hypothetical protein